MLFIRTLICLLTSMLALAPAAETRAKSLIKWVDDNGQVHYSDTLPLESLNRERKELSRQGRELRTVEPPKPRERLLEERRVKEEVKAREDRDRILKESYNNADEIVATRDRRIAVLDAEIRVTEALIATLKQQLQDMIAKAASWERSGQSIPDTDHRNIQETRQQISQNQAFIEQKQREMAFPEVRRGHRALSGATSART